MLLGILSFILILSKFTHAQSDIPIEIQADRPEIDFEVRDIEQTVCWENDPRPECGEGRQEFNKSNISSEQDRGQDSDLCAPAYQSAIAKCKATLNEQSANVVSAYANSFSRAQLAGNIKQACEAARQINLLSGNVNSVYSGQCRSAAAACSNKCSKNSKKKNECSNFLTTASQSNQQAILNAQLALRSQSCAEAVKGSLTELNAANTQRSLSDSTALNRQLAFENNIEKSERDSSLNPPKVDLEKLRFTEKGYDYEGNGKVKGSKSTVNTQNQEGRVFIAGNGGSQPLDPVSEEKINSDFIKDDKVILGAQDNSQYAIEKNSYEESTSRGYGSAGSITGIKDKGYDLQKLIPKNQFSKEDPVQKYLNKKYPDKNLFSTRIISSLDEAIGYEVEYTESGENIYLTRPIWFFVSMIIIAVFTLAFIYRLFLTHR